MAEPPDLLFFDTFSHESNEELNLDLVQFPKPVYVSEVRIIPLGARVQGDFPGGVRLGATNPSQFQIDFFVNDLSKPGAPTFETLGSLEYCQNGRIHMDCEGSSENPRQIPTDGLVLRGWYTTITLAVYGTITKNITEQVNSGSSAIEGAPPPPAPVATPPSTAVTAQPWSDLPPDVYPASNYSQDSYDQANYPPEYFNQDVPKDPRSYHHPSDDGNGMWDMRDDKDRREISRERDSAHAREKERSRHSSIVRDGIRMRSRSIERAHSRDHNSPRYSRSRSRDRDYHSLRRDDNFRRDASRSPVYRERSISRDKDWDRSYKRDDYRRHRQSSYERSRGSSYEKKRGSPYEKRGPSYERRPPSFENRTPTYEKRLSPYEKRAPSYEKRYDKRAPSYDRIREPSYDSRSRSPGREDPRKRPRTPPPEHSRRPHTPIEMAGSHDRDNVSPIDSVVSDDDVCEYEHGSKTTQSKDETFNKNYKNRKITSKTESDKLLHVSKDVNVYDSQYNSLVTVNVNDNQTSPNPKANTPLVSPVATHEDNNSIDTEQFEPILSDEDICDDIDGSFAEEYEMNEYCGMEDVLKCFNPFRVDWQKYVPVNKSPLFLSSEGFKDVMSVTIDNLCSLNISFQKLVDIVNDFKKIEHKYTVHNFSNLTADAKEEWIEICEQLPSLLSNIGNESDILYRIFCMNHSKEPCIEIIKNIREFLLNFCRIGLDYDLALSQYQATYKIRHIKCGIRLVDALSSHKYNEVVVMCLLNNKIDVYVKLLKLYSKSHMALSIKLIILKALDSCLASEATIEHFLTKSYNDDLFYDENIKKESSETVELKNGYQIFLVMLAKNPLSRLKFAINALINKLNFYELLKKFHGTVLQINVRQNNDMIVSGADIEFIINSLEEIVSVYRKGSFTLSQPRRFLPVSAQFEINKTSVNDTLINFFRIHKLVETFLYLLTCPVTYSYTVITNPIYEVMVYLINSHEGLLYLVDNIKTCHLLFQTLMLPFTHQNEEDQMIILQDYNGCTSLQQLGLEMAYKMQALFYINALFDIEMKNDDNESELFDNLHGLYCLAFGNIGKLAVANVLSMGDNVQCLLNIYEKDISMKMSDKEENQVGKTKSPTKNYAVDMTVLTVQFSGDVAFLKKFGKRILSVAKKFDLYEQSIASNLQEVLPYLKPLEKSNIFLNDSICDLVDILKSSIEHVTSAPGDLITCLRILKYLGIPETENKKMPLGDHPKVEFTELKYKYVIIQLYSLDGVSLLVSILEKLCSYFEQPCLHSATFVSLHGLHIANIVLPTLELLNKMLTYVIQCRNTQFKDLTSIPVVLQAYNLMYSYPITSIGYKMSQRACRECIEILLAHTQPIADDTGESEAIHKSLWTLLCSEIIKYILTGPYTFIPGLLIFSEILPLPLPIQTKYNLSETELNNMVSNRKLWSAHLHTLSSNITEMIQTMCLSVCQPVIHLLRKVCIQLTDLASNMALCVTKAILDLFIMQVCGENNSVPQSMQPLNYDAARILNFLACLVSHPPVKCSILHLIKQGVSVSKTEDKYALFIPLLCSILTVASDVQSHVQAQECIVSIISSFYDSEITLLTQIDSLPSIKSENQEQVQDIKPILTPEIYLANAIPHKETLMSLINASFEYMSNENSQLALTLPILRTFFLMNEHDYGFYYFKLCLDKNKPVFFQLLTKLVAGLSKESPECLSTFFELLKSLQSTAEYLDTSEGLQFIPRTNVLTINDVAEIIGWNRNKETHPLYTLEKYLKEVNTDDELLTHVRQLISTLSTSSGLHITTSETSSVPIPPVIGTPETLVAQFGGRCLWTQGDAQDERLGSSYWLGINITHNEDEVVEAEMVPCDLTELTQNYLAVGTDLVAEAERLLHLPPAAPRPPTEPPLFRTKRLHVPKDKRPYISPARGRGVTQQSSIVGVGSGAPRIQVDAFRSRPPNTSRPPSLHVDDFLALEGCGAQPTGPTGYNKLPIMAARGGRGLRSRGITITDRGRFASSMPTTSTIYSRRGRGTWNTSNVTSSNIASDSSPPLTGHYSRVSASQHFQPPISQHSTNASGWSGASRGGRRGRGLRHSRASFLR